MRVSNAAAAAQNWQIGDQMTIPLPQLGETYYPIIDALDEGPGNSRAALAKSVSTDGHTRRIVVTVGPTSTFAFIDTPHGVYELVAEQEFGWLLPATSMMSGFDFSQPDYILPDDTRRRRLAPATGETGYPDAVRR